MLTDYHVHLRPDDAGHAAASATSPPPTPSATARPPPSAASPSSASPSTSTASPQALDVWEHEFWRQCARRRPRRLLRVRARGDRPAARHRGRLRPRPRGPHGRRCSTARDWDYVVGSVHFLGDARASTTTSYDVWTTRRVGRPRLAALLRVARRGGAQRACSTSSPTPTSSSTGARERPVARARPALLLRARDGGRSRSPAIAIEVSTAGLRKPVGEIYPARAFLEMVRRRRQPDRAVQRRPRARPARLRLRAGASSCSTTLGVTRARASSSAAQRRLEPHRAT